MVLVIIFSTLLMTFTGTILKYPKITNIIPFDLVFIRNLHNVTSPLFSVVLILMMVSGAVMYFYPLWNKKKVL